MRFSNYWDKYYLSNFDKSPSNFAIFCLKNYLSTNQSIIDVGCGCGQDSLFFYNNGLQVIGIDNSQVIINKLQKKYNYKNISFVKSDVTKKIPKNVDNIYSRWVLHAMSWRLAKCFLKNTYKSLNLNGKLFIECRSYKDDNAKLRQSHYRNFIKIQELEEFIKKINMAIIFSSEQKGWSKKENGDDPFLIRMIAVKK